MLGKKCSSCVVFAVCVLFSTSFINLLFLEPPRVTGSIEAVGSSSSAVIVIDVTRSC